MTSKARIGVIGAGWWAVENHLPILAEDPAVELTAVSRLGREELQLVKERFGFQLASEDYREILTADLDGVVVSSPHVLHFEHASAALERGCHVMVEKPLATTAGDARRLVELANERNLQILVPYGWNFKPYTQRAREFVRSGRIGDIRHVALHMASALHDLFAGEAMKETEDATFRPPASTWAQPERAGGYGWGQLSHCLGLLFHTTELTPRIVYGLMGESPTGADYYDAVTVGFVNGATATVSGSATAPKHTGFQMDIRMFGTEGMLLLDIERERLELRRHDGNDEVVPMKPGDGDYECVEPVRRFVEICQGSASSNEAPGEVGMRAVEVLDAAYRSARSGKPVEVGQ